MKTLLIILLFSAAAVADYPLVPKTASIDMETLVRLAHEGRILKATLSEEIPRLRDIDATFIKIFADLAPEFRWNTVEQRPGYTITVSIGDYFNQRSDVTHSALITTDKHIVCIRLRHFDGLFHLIGYAVELKRMK